MPSIHGAFPSKFLKADDFPQPYLLTIKYLDFDNVGDERKPVLFFWEIEKGLVLNRTNANMVEEIARTDDYANWSNVQVEAYVKADVEFQGKTVKAIRLRPPAPTGNLSPGQQAAAELGQPNALVQGQHPPQQHPPQQQPPQQHPPQQQPPQHWTQGAQQPPQAQHTEYRQEEQLENDDIPF
jgi:hypothetical protein